MKHLIYLLLLSTVFGNAQHTLTIEADGILTDDGYIGVGVYDTEKTFLKKEKTFAGAFALTQKGKTMITIADLPEGTYAISIFHDKNGNKKLDTNFIGIPMEPVAFSKAKMKPFGPPDFKACSFNLTSDYQIKIPIK